MIPVFQDKFYDPEAPPNQQRGNCLTGVVASLVELPLHSVPNFIQDHVDHMDVHEHAGEWDWWTRLHSFLHDNGYRMHYLRPVENPDCPEANPWFPPEKDEYYAVSGISPRSPDIHHVVIYQNGKMVHDPHPDGTGLASVDDEYHWSLRSIS